MLIDIFRTILRSFFVWFIGCGLSAITNAALAQGFQLGIPSAPAASVNQSNQNKWSPPAVLPNITSDIYQDNKNGVSWRRCELGKSFAAGAGVCIGTTLRMSWVDAIEVVNELNSNGFEGRRTWRLPSGLELRSLLLDDPIIRAGRYPARFGNASAFGGYFIDTDEKKCAAANQYVYQLFGKPNDQTGDFFASQRWMADNTDQKAWQGPLSINLVSSWGMKHEGYCNLIINAFLEDQFDGKRPGTMRPHAALPVLVVYGGQADANWTSAQMALDKKTEILAQSRLTSKQELAGLIATYTKVRDYVKDALAHGAQGGNITGGAGQKKFSCSYQCVGSLFATGARHTATSWGSDESAARAALKPDAEKICSTENRNRSGAWWADMAICKEQ